MYVMALFKLKMNKKPLKFVACGFLKLGQRVVINKHC